MTATSPLRPAAPRTRRAPRRSGVRTALGIVAALTVAASAFVAPASAAPAPFPVPAAPFPAEPLPDDLAETLVRQVAPSTVDISTNLRLQDAAGVGAGVVLSPDGEVLTNNHVVEGGTEITATDNGTGRSYPVEVLGYDRSRDIALLRLLGASGLLPAPLGDSATVAPGSPIVSIGNSDGVDGTVAAAPGVVTDTGQTVTAVSDLSGVARELVGLIEFDADLRPGDSGGPLVDGTGRVVGLNTAGNANFDVGTRGQGFAIPLADALGIAAQIRAGIPSETVHVGPTPFLGIAGTPTDDGRGVLVRDVVAGAPADLLGLRGGDVIVSVDGVVIDDPGRLTTLLDQRRPGDTVLVGWVDTEGVAQQAPAVLIAGPAG